MNFWGPFALLVFLSLMIFSHFDALSRLLSCLNALVLDESFPFLMNFLLDEPSTLLDAHFFFTLIGISFLFP